ncbi:MAG: alanine--tRNA ligase [Verrucomicrobiota bacterium]
MTASEIRQSYLDFFESKKHTIVPSSSLMPDSPNLLFTNAGMNQFVPIFLGETKCPYKPGRSADTQKCIRAGGKHNDLEDVGLDTYHHTFFEMLGNWSFGDYFKKEAIEWAWELVVGIWKFPAERVYATVYKPGKGDPSEFDQEAYDHWEKIFKKAGLDPKVHICYGNKKDNFWMMGDTGPCGPCSELHIDLTPNGDTQGKLVNAGDARCIEIWNLVFIQFNANADGTFAPLPAKHVDTGMGFERVCGIIQGTNNFKNFKNARISNYETDVFSPIFKELERISGKKYSSTLPSPGSGGANEQEKIDVAFRVISDHIRTLSFAIADGILPSNENRGYVLRRILRRAVRYGRQLGLHDLFFYKLVDVLAQQMGDIFPEIREKKETVKKIIRGEEESFSKTLDRGIELFEKSISELQNEAHSGGIAFYLYDTYGFPLDLTQLMARERGITINEAVFNKLMAEQQKRSQAAQKKQMIEIFEASNAKPSKFVGYDQKENIPVEEIGISEDIDNLKIPVVLSLYPETPFYAEMGGQVGDQGVIAFDQHKIRILDTKRGNTEHFFRHITEDINEVKLFLENPSSFKVYASVDMPRRAKIEGHHTATHLLHWAMREVLGKTVQQKGSFVGPDHLRFDFSHIEAVKPDELRQIEKLVNELIQEHASVKWSNRPYAEIKNDPKILQFFGEKYSDVVRVLEVGDFSKELCGGTHVRNTGDIGLCRITSEGAIAAGIRRIEAICGEALRPYLETEFKKQDERFASLQKRRATDIAWQNDLAVAGKIDALWNTWQSRKDQLAQLESDLREWEKQQSKNRDSELKKLALEKSDALLPRIKSIDNLNILIADLGEADSALLPQLVDALKTKIEGVIVLAAKSGEKVALIAYVSSRYSQKIQAGKIIQQIAPLVGGKGGGRPDLAQGGGTNTAGIDQALAKAKEIIQNS